MRFLKKIGLLFLVLILILALVYLLGPKHPFTPFDANPITTHYNITQLDKIIEDRESQHTLKPNNESKILWYDGVKKTRYGILYLHGWSASQGEADPMHTELAEKYGANLTLARLPGHGLIGEDLLLNTTADEVVTYAKEIINIAAQTCDSLIVFSCSTGSTLSAYLSSEDERIKVQIMTSPNFGILDPSFDLLDRQWGIQIAEIAFGSKYNTWEPPHPKIHDYWYTKYRIEGLAVCDQLVSNTMQTEVFEKIKSPVYIGYYYKNEEEKDKVVDVDLIQPFVESIATPQNKVTTQAFTQCNFHVMTNPYHCNDYHLIRESIETYLETSLKIQPKLMIDAK